MKTIEQLRQEYIDIQTKPFEDWLEDQGKSLKLLSVYNEDVIEYKLPLPELISKLQEFIGLDNLHYYINYDNNFIISYTTYEYETSEQQQRRFTKEYSEYKNKQRNNKSALIKQINDLEFEALKQRNAERSTQGW